MEEVAGTEDVIGDHTMEQDSEVDVKTGLYFVDLSLSFNGGFDFITSDLAVFSYIENVQIVDVAPSILSMGGRIAITTDRY